MGSEVRVYADNVTLAQRLDELGVHQEVLREAIEFGVRYTLECTRHDPPNLGGILAWGKTTRSLRDQLVPVGWKPDNARNYATVIHPSLDYAIAVAGGDAFTGLKDRTPATRSEKGPATKDAIAANQMSFTDIDASFPPPEVARVRQTWLLLYFLDDDAAEIRMELSLPAAMTEEGYVISWRERLILPPIVLSPTPFASRDTEGEEIEVTVDRRSS